MHVATTMRALAATAVSGGLLLTGGAPSLAAQPQPSRPASWRVAVRVTGSKIPGFSAVTAVSSTSAWAFGQDGRFAYQLSGSTWTRHAIPVPAGDTVVAASSSSHGNVWAFTIRGRAIHYNGRRWTLAVRFRRPIGSGLAINRRDVWIFGGEFHTLGTWHFNGERWRHVRSGTGLYGASALSPGSIWAYGDTVVAHWNGRSWRRTSVKALLPKNTALSFSRLTGIDAISADNVYAVGSAGIQDNAPGRLVVLHYNGHAWARVASVRQGTPVAVISDGHGGLWIPASTGEPGSGTMDHYARGKLSVVPMPYRSAHLGLFDAATGGHTPVAFAVGLYRKSYSSIRTTALILRYGR